MTECKHKLRTLQVSQVINSSYFGGIFQCEKCLGLFVSEDHKFYRMQFAERDHDE